MHSMVSSMPCWCSSTTKAATAAVGKFFWFLLFNLLTLTYFTFFGEHNQPICIVLHELLESNCIHVEDCMPRLCIRTW